MEGRGILQDLILDVGELELVPVPGKIAHIDTVSRRLTMFIYGEGVLRCYLTLSQKLIPNSQMYSSLQPAWIHLNL